MPHYISASSATFLLALSTAIGALAGTGCSSSRGASDSAETVQQETNAKIREAKNEAIEAATLAQSKAAEARRGASREEAAEATQTANAAVVEANQKARGEIAAVQANANVEIRRANRKTARGTTDLREWSQKRMDDIDNAIDAARAKEQTAAPKLRADFEVGMKAVEIRRDALRAQVASIETQSEEDMAAFKARFEKEGNQLKHQLDELSTALTAEREGAG